MKRLILVLVILALGGGGYAYYTKHRAPTTPPDGKLRVVASFYPLAEFSRQVTGNRADITTITPAGAEPHDYEPTPQDIVNLQKAKVFFYNGSGVETWADKAVADAKGSGVTTVNMTDHFSLLAGDPHIWLDPVDAQREVQIIVDAVRRADPVNSLIYQANADAYIAQLHGLDQEYRLGLSDCASKDIVTSHAAFAYLAKEYGLNQVSVAGLSPDAEPSPKQLADVTTFARAHNITYIFFETLVSPKLAETVAREVGAQTLVLNPLEGLSDAQLAAGDNYITVMRNNLTNLRTALQCQ